jgi:hypothetical protein
MSMEKRISRKDLWDGAGKAGLVLGLVSSAYVLISMLLSKLNGSTGMALLSTVLAFLLWALKFGGCIYLMKLFMTRFAAAHPGCDNSDTFRFGMATAFLSALIFSAFDMAYLTWIAPDTMSQAIETATEAYGSMLPAESLEAMQEMNFGQISFFTNLIYCFLFGTVLSAILSRNIPSRNPFADNRPTSTPDEQ